MSYSYTPPPPQSGVTPGDLLWKFTTPPGPGLIELDAANGVTGIDTGYTLDAKNHLKLIANLIAFSRASNVNEILLQGIQGDTVRMLYNNLLTNAVHSNQVNAAGISNTSINGSNSNIHRQDATSTHTDLINGTGGQSQETKTASTNDLHITQANNVSQKYMTATENQDSVQDLGANNNVFESRFSDQYVLALALSGVAIAETLIDALETSFTRNTANGAMVLRQVENGAGAGSDLQQLILFDNGLDCTTSAEVYKVYAQLQYADDPLGVNNRMQIKARIDRASIEFNDAQQFAIKTDGKIQTNQTAAPGAHAVLAAELPIYDNGGSLVGYIPIFT